ncbi:MAG: hypothetical protein NVSMB18_06450 [Acetobacteraceae bacterium]
MAASPAVRSAIAYEVEALLTRLDRIRPFAMQTPMVLAAALSPEAQIAIERYLARGRRNLRALAHSFLRRLTAAVQLEASELQRGFVVLRLVFTRAFNQFEMFADALSQRAQHDFGIWIGGLDAVAEDALALVGNFYQAPPVITYLDRGMGAAIRRARTRLPGGGSNPVSLIRLPRERMVGGGVGSSLVHEVGHQAAALLGLIPSLRAALHERQRLEPSRAHLWVLWERWISEIAADLWSVARLGAGSTLGLMQVVALPRAFVFRLHPTDPHPFPWIRVLASCAIGRALFPDPQWRALAAQWGELYPLGPDAPAEATELAAHAPVFAELLAAHRPAALRGLSMREALRVDERTPRRLRRMWDGWAGDASAMVAAAPTLALAVLGQARADGRLRPAEDSALHAQLLQAWALAGAVSVASRPPPAALALPAAPLAL